MANGTLKVQNIETSSGSGTITLGQSGETIALGSGVTSKLNQPAFEAYASTDQNITNGTTVKAQIDTEVFDTDNCYDNSTNYRFTPTVAGRYYCYFGAKMQGQSDTMQYAVIYIYKNGSVYRGATIDPKDGQMSSSTPFISAVLDMNGTTDYIEAYGTAGATSGSVRFDVQQKQVWFGAYRLGVE